MYWKENLFCGLRFLEVVVNHQNGSSCKYNNFFQHAVLKAQKIMLQYNSLYGFYSTIAFEEKQSISYEYDFHK